LPEILLSLLLAPSPLAAAQAPTALAPLSARLQNERDNADLQKFAPFKVFDNLYYIGVGWVASWLLTTSDGLIVIDTLEPRYATHLVDGIVKLGFDPRRIKHVIVLQAHVDHLGGAALLQEKYGAKVWMGERDWEMLAAGDRPRGGRTDAAAGRCNSGYRHAHAGVDQPQAARDARSYARHDLDRADRDGRGARIQGLLLRWFGSGARQSGGRAVPGDGPPD
jgi:glyoxylase-like metal-dependent hydrolase (beta-lactamase superfamily II)